MLSVTTKTLHTFFWRSRIDEEKRGRGMKRLDETNSTAKDANWKANHSLLRWGFCRRAWQQMPCHLGESLRQGVRESIVHPRTAFPPHPHSIFPLCCSGSSSSNSLLQVPYLQCTYCRSIHNLANRSIRTNRIRRRKNQPSWGCCLCTSKAWYLSLDLRL